MKIKFTFILLLFVRLATAQNYGNVWRFGQAAGIDFNSCEPSVFTQGIDVGSEGCSAISNAAGQLLFYTNSDSVWDRTNHSMPNGYLIPASGTLSQVLIIPKPLSTTIYYVITTTIQGTSPHLEYHTVDMSLHGGLGDVMSKNNVLSTSLITEQVAATYHQDGADIWLMVHEYLTNRFFAYLVTASGISSTPVISAVGPAHHSCISGINARGQIKFSPDGTKVAFTANGVGTNDSTNILCVFDFNRTTGAVSNPVNLPYGRGDFGLSFSADNSKLYESTWKAFAFTASDKNYIYQFDLSAGAPAAIAASRYCVDSATSVYGDMKLAPDGKIYISIYNQMSLAVINAPDQAGSACNYNAAGFSLSGKRCWAGLNNYIEYSSYCNTTGVPEVENSTAATVFPNPFRESATLQFPYSIGMSCTLTIYNVQGQAVRTIPGIRSGNVTIIRGELAAGLYFYRLYSEGRAFAGGKLAIQ